MYIVLVLCNVLKSVLAAPKWQIDHNQNGLKKVLIYVPQIGLNLSKSVKLSNIKVD